MTDNVTEMKPKLPKASKELRDSMIMVMDMALKGGGMQIKAHVDILTQELMKLVDLNADQKA